MKLRTLIVDDEQQSRMALQSLLERYFPGIEICGQAKNASEARDLIRMRSPDLVFLDISMPGENGFDLLRSCPDRLFQVVFATAYDHFAVRAFRANAIDYLLKPLAIEDLREAIAKVTSIITSARAGDENKSSGGGATEESKHLRKAQEAALQNLDHSIRTQRLERLSLQSSQGTDLVDIAEISYLGADSNYTHFHLSSGKKLLVCHPLKDYEEILEPEGFFRVHRSFMINMLHLKAYTNSPLPEAILKDGTRIEVSRRRVALFQEQIRKWRRV